MQIFLVVIYVMLSIISLTFYVGIKTRLLYPGVVALIIFLMKDLNTVSSLVTKWNGEFIPTMFIIAYITLALSFIPIILKLKNLFSTVIVLIVNSLIKIKKIFISSIH